MNIAVYVRVSTQRQAQAQTIEQQLDSLRKYHETQGWVSARLRGSKQQRWLCVLRMPRQESWDHFSPGRKMFSTLSAS